MQSLHNRQKVMTQGKGNNVRKGIHKKFVITQGLPERRSEHRKQVDQYHRVTFLSGGIHGTHQLKICTKSTKSMDLMVEEKSIILKQLKLKKIFAF